MPERSVSGSPIAARSTPTGIKLCRHPVISGHFKSGGSLGKFERAWIYAADCGRGLVKIGMTSDIPARMKAIRGTLIHSVEVLPGNARKLETAVMRCLGKKRALGATEYLKMDHDRARSAIDFVISEISRTCAVQPAEKIRK